MTLQAILTALGLLAIFHEDVRGPEKEAQLNAIAAAVAKVSQTQDEAAFLIAWSNAETHFSLRIAQGDCRRWECDPVRHADGSMTFRARGPWQAHRNGMSDDSWARMTGIENVEHQAEVAARHARWALSACHETGDARILGAFRLLGAKHCDQAMKGERERLATYRKVRGLL